MACVSKIGSLYEMVTKNVIVSTTNTIFGINPRAWIALPSRLPRRKNKLEGSDLRSRPRSFRWCGSHSKKYDSRIPVFPVWEKKE